MKLSKALVMGWIGSILMVGPVVAESRLTTEFNKRCRSAKDVASMIHTGPEWKKNIYQAGELYFYGYRCVSSGEDKKTFHLQGFQFAKNAISLLTGGDSSSDTPQDSTLTKELALAHYYAAVNLSRWGQATGILTSLGRWGEVEGHLKAVMRNDVGVVDYGAFRTFGRAYMKLPFFKGGSYKKSEKYLAKAYAQTLNTTFNTSSNTLTTLYYLDTLSRRNKDDEFCDVYAGLEGIESFDWEQATELNAERVMETLLDIQDFKTSREDWIVDIKDKADIDC